MPVPSRAHLLLPSPQGLLHYDVLEETVFLGRTPRGGLIAGPGPFRGATIVLSDDGSGFVARSLPGEPPPDVNGAANEGARLADGDRIRLGDQVALFRSGALAPPPPPRPAVAAAAPAATPSAAAAPRPRRAPTRPGVPAGSRNAARVLLFCGALVFVFAAYQAVRYLQTPPAPPVSVVTERMKQSGEVVVSRADELAAKAYAEAEAYEGEHRTDYEGAVTRYVGIVKSSPNTSSALRAAAKVSELWPRLAATAWAALEPELDAAIRSGKYRRSIAAIDAYLARYGGTEPAALAQAKLEVARTGARAALDGLRQRAAPLITTDPTRAYRFLTSSGLELPADLEAELAALMARVREAWGTPTGDPHEPGASTGAPGQPAREPGPPRGLRPPTKAPGEDGSAPATPDSVRETQAKSVWTLAHADLLAKKWVEAKRGYSSLLKEFKDTSVVAAHPDRVRAGRQAADFGLRGPAALLAGDATYRDGRLEVEYRFENDKAFRADFAIEQPFPGDETAAAEVRYQMAILSGSTSMLLKVVFDPSDAVCEADCVADEPRDFGVVGFQEGRAYRAVAVHVGNTQFKLKKGPGATVLAGHVLWLFGDGVWKDADAGERGFVRLAVQNGNKLKGGEKTKVRLELKGTQVAGLIQAKSDTVDLKGPLKGDDGKGVGPLRLGAFTYKGRVGIERLFYSGKVDEAWAQQQHKALLDAETGPDAP